MRIEEVRLRNFRSYGNNTTEVRLRPGLNVLLGRIGSGKSSILEAILIALFGFQRSGIRKTDVLRRDSTSEGLQIELTFLFDGMHFKVCRGAETRLETSPDGTAWTLISEKSGEIDDHIESTLEVTGRKFRDLFYASQGELTNVITGSPEERQKSIDKLLGAEGLRDTYERLTEFVKFYDEDIGDAKGKLAEIDAYLKRHDLDSMRDEKRKHEAEIIDIGKRMENLATEISGLKKRIDDLALRGKPLEDASARLDALERELTKYRNGLEKEKYRLGELVKRKGSLEEEIKVNGERVDRLRPEVERTRGLCRDKEKVWSDLNEIKSKASRRLDEMERLRREIAEGKERIEREGSEEERIRSLIKEAEERIRSTAARMEDRNERLASARDALVEAKAELPEAEDGLRKADLELAKIGTRARENAERIATLNSLSEGAQCPFCEQAITQAHRAKVIGRLEKLVRGTLREEERGRSAAEECRNALARIKEKIETLGEEVREYEKGLAEMRADSAREEQNASNIGKNLEESSRRKKQLVGELGEAEKEMEAAARDLRDLGGQASLEGEEWPEKLEEAIRLAAEERDNARKALSETEGDLRSAEKLVSKAMEETGSTAAEIEVAQKAVGELEAEVSRSEGEIAAIYEPLVGKAEDPRGRLREMITRNREEIQEQRDALKAKEISKVELSGEFKAKTDTVAQLGERIEEYIAERERRVGLKRRMTVYSEAKNLLQQIRDKYKDAREMIRTNLINVLRETLRVEFEKLYAYEDFHDVKVSDDYEVSLEGPVGEINAHNLSAGQKAIASIAFRLAVAKAMEMRIGCWIIDEPTQNIGKAEVEALADVLADTSEIPQIVVASHHEALGRHGNVVSLGIRRGETVLGEGSQPLAPTIDGGEGTVASNGPAK